MNTNYGSDVDNDVDDADDVAIGTANDTDAEDSNAAGAGQEGAATDGAEGAGKPPAATDDDDPDDKNFRLRLSKALAQRDSERAAIAERDRVIAELQAKLESAAPKGPSALDTLRQEAETLYEQVEEARADANVKEAARLQRQLDTLNRQIITAEAASAATTEISVRSTASRYNQMADFIESNYDVLNPASDEYDDAKAATLNELVEAYEAKGLTATQALAKAATLVLGVDPFAAPAAARAKAPAAPTPTNRAPNIDKAIAAASRQPSRVQPASTTTPDVPNVNDLTDEEFAALPEKVRAKMRGDA